MGGAFRKVSMWMGGAGYSGMGVGGQDIQEGEHVGGWDAQEVSTWVGRWP